MAQVNVQQYMDTHRVHHLFKEMLSMLLLEMPRQPIPWLVSHLQAKLEVHRCAPAGWALQYGDAEGGAMSLGDLDTAEHPSNEEAAKTGSPPRSSAAAARSSDARTNHFDADPGGDGDGGHDPKIDTARMQTERRPTHEEQCIIDERSLPITLAKGAAQPLHQKDSHDPPGPTGGPAEEAWLARGFTRAVLHREPVRAGERHAPAPTLLVCSHCTRFLEGGDQQAPSVPPVSPPPSSVTVSNTLSRLFRTHETARGADRNDGCDEDDDDIVEDLADESGDDFESASQVTGPRQPVWDTERDTAQMSGHSARSLSFTDGEPGAWATRVSDSVATQSQRALHAPPPVPEREGLPRSRPASSPGNPTARGNSPRAERAKAKSLCGEDLRDFDRGRPRKVPPGGAARPAPLSASRAAGDRNEMPFLEIKKLFPEPRSKTSGTSSQTMRRNRPRSFVSELNASPLSATENVPASPKDVTRPLSPSNRSDLFEQPRDRSGRPHSGISQTSINQSSRPHTPIKHSEPFHQASTHDNRPDTPTNECGASRQSRIRGSRPQTPVYQTEVAQQFTSNTVRPSTPIAQTEPFHQPGIHASRPQTPNSHRETSPQSEIVKCSPGTPLSDIETVQRPSTKTSRPQTPISQSGGSDQPSGNPSRPQTPNRSEAFQQIGSSKSRPQTPVSGDFTFQDTKNNTGSRTQSPTNQSERSQRLVGKPSRLQTPSNESEQLNKTYTNISRPRTPIDDGGTQQQTSTMTDSRPTASNDQSGLPHHPIGTPSRPQTPNNESETFQKPGTSRSRPQTPTSNRATSQQRRNSTSGRPATPSNQSGLSHHPSGKSSRPQTPRSVRGSLQESKDTDDAPVTPSRDGRAENEGHPGAEIEKKGDPAREQGPLGLDNAEASMQGGTVGTVGTESTERDEGDAR